MNVIDVVEQLIKQDPSKVSTKQDALKHIFLVSGNGLGWNNNGEALFYTNVPLWTEEQEYAAIQDLPERIQDAVKPIVEKRVQSNQRVLQRLDEELENNVESLSGDVFVERGCLAWTMPENVSADWKNAFAKLTEDANIIIDE